MCVNKSKDLSFTLEVLSVSEDKIRDSWTYDIKPKISISLSFYICMCMNMFLCRSISGFIHWFLWTKLFTVLACSFYISCLRHCYDEEENYHNLLCITISCTSLQSRELDQ